MWNDRARIDLANDQIESTNKSRSQILKIKFAYLESENKALRRSTELACVAFLKTRANFQSKEPRRIHWRTGALNHAIPRGSAWHNVETMGRQA
jgi:hypothetical protein